MPMTFEERTRLNAICPYFTMFPLSFPYEILSRKAGKRAWVLDPFCGRGTTVYASRVLGLPAIGIDSSPVAVAISRAKLASATPEAIVQEARQILTCGDEPGHVPQGEFWNSAFHRDVLRPLCQLREALLEDYQSEVRQALRGIVLGALHGPMTKTRPSHFSNQSQRTYAPKPDYAVDYWTRKGLRPPHVNVIDIIEARAKRFYRGEKRAARGAVIIGDSRREEIFSAVPRKVRWVITSPPYLGMRTYLPDQWLRGWFLGGRAEVQYSVEGQIGHSSAEIFAAELRKVWENVGQVCELGAKMVIRFGGINTRKADPIVIIKRSFKETAWKVNTIRSAGSASEGKRQAIHIKSKIAKAREEFDVWATWNQ